jgi:hypothetical protein
MARWVPKPDDPIGPDEPIGRRIFDEPMLTGAQGQGPFPGISVRHFEENRDGEVSLDRCGRTNVEGGVLAYLFPRARAMGAAFNPPKPFTGWLAVRARQLAEPTRGPRLPPNPSPQSGVDENVYHAHIATPGGMDHYIMALLLREIFARHGFPIRQRKTA